MKTLRKILTFVLFLLFVLLFWMLISIVIFKIIFAAGTGECKHINVPEEYKGKTIKVLYLQPAQDNECFLLLKEEDGSLKFVKSNDPPPSIGTFKVEIQEIKKVTEEGVKEFKLINYIPSNENKKQYPSNEQRLK